MQRRNRIPSIFNIYMVDVLCCALGCVVLLWQVYFAEAEMQTAAVRAAMDDINKLSGTNKSLQDYLNERQRELEESRTRETRSQAALDEHRRLTDPTIPG